MKPHPTGRLLGGFLPLLVVLLSTPADSVDATVTKRDMQWQARSSAGLGTAATAGLKMRRPITMPEGTQLLPNGDFEQGPTIWAEFSQNGWDIILNTSDPFNPPPVPPHSGEWLAWLGGDLDEISYIEQEVTVPAGTSTLAYWEWIDSEDNCGHDIVILSVNGSVVEQYDLCEDSTTLDWMLHEVDISSYAGQTVSIRIRVDTDAVWNSNLWVDDVAFELPDLIFTDGFEFGDTSAWSSAVP